MSSSCADDVGKKLCLDQRSSVKAFVPLSSGKISYSRNVENNKCFIKKEKEDKYCLQLDRSAAVTCQSTFISTMKKSRTSLSCRFKTGKKLIRIPPRTRIVSKSKVKIGKTIKLQKVGSSGSSIFTSVSSSSSVARKLVLIPKYSAAAVPMIKQEPTSSVESPHKSLPCSFASTFPSGHLNSSTVRPKPLSLKSIRRATSITRHRNSNSNNNREKGGKGLRHFAMLVCEKVKEKQTTTYNEVADELVADYAPDKYDHKNIRRRVYDALNVLMAMNIIYKDKKSLHWVGLPTDSSLEVQALQSEKTKREQRIEQKTYQLQELMLQLVAFKNLIERNRSIEEILGGSPANKSCIQLPFVVMNTDHNTLIDCKVSEDKREYLFSFDKVFGIHDDLEVLKRMGLTLGLHTGNSTPESLKRALTLVPPAMRPYLEVIGMKETTEFPDVNLSSAASSLCRLPRRKEAGSSSSSSERRSDLFRVINVDSSSEVTSIMSGCDDDDDLAPSSVFLTNFLTSSPSRIAEHHPVVMPTTTTTSRRDDLLGEGDDVIMSGFEASSLSSSSSSNSREGFVSWL